MNGDRYKAEALALIRSALQGDPSAAKRKPAELVAWAWEIIKLCNTAAASEALAAPARIP